MRIESKDQFAALQMDAKERDDNHSKKVLVCCGTGCLATGAKEVAEAFAHEIEERGLDVEVGLGVKSTGCHGFCERGPLVVFLPEGLLYTKVKAKRVPEIVEKTVIGQELIPGLLYKNPVDNERIPAYEEIPFYKNQVRVAMRNIGRIDPTDLMDAVAHDSYSGLARALFDMTPDEVLDDVELSGQRGRGGAGFYTARKWRSCKAAPGDRRFVLCNGDEGDPGAFKDRSIMEGDPHSVLEGMIIAAFAVGANEGYIYVRDEYPLAVVNLQVAIIEARKVGLLGENIMGSGFDFDIQISRGGGAFVCGESSALMRSLAGKTGEPRAKYVHSTEKGLFDLPTVLNNVETLAGIGAIVHHGSAWFAAMGHPMHLLVGIQHNPYIDRMLSRFRQAMGVKLIPATVGARGILRALKANHVVGVAADQHAGAGLPIEFFGRRAYAARGPATFTAKVGAPLIPYLMRRERFDRHVVMAGKPLTPAGSGDPQRDIDDMTIALNRFYEDTIRRYPDQWMWTHRRWKSVEKESNL